MAKKSNPPKKVGAISSNKTTQKGLKALQPFTSQLALMARNLPAIKEHEYGNTKATTTKEAQTEMLGYWMESVDKAMFNVWQAFSLSNGTCILSESDLKCWLFYYLKNERPQHPYLIHTEVAHYHHKQNPSDSDYSLRDLSLLSPGQLITNTDLLKQLTGDPNGVLKSKGFKHEAPAIHFELKFLKLKWPEKRLSNEFTKLNKYIPNRDKAERRLVIVWGSRNPKVTTHIMLQLLQKHISSLRTKSLINHLDFYLFDQTEIVKCRIADLAELNTNRS